MTPQQVRDALLEAPDNEIAAIYQCYQRGRMHWTRMAADLAGKMFDRLGVQEPGARVGAYMALCQTGSREAVWFFFMMERKDANRIRRQLKTVQRRRRQTTTIGV